MSEAPPPAAPPAAPPAPPAAPPAASAPWYGDKVDEVTRGFWQNKGLDPSDPVNVATGLTKFYREFESWRGVPPEELVRMPKPNAAEADIKAYLTKIGVPTEAKEYDLSTVKYSDGRELDAGFTETFRAAALAARVPKDQASGMLAAMVKHMEDGDKAVLTERSARVREQQEALDKNWGTNKNYNTEVAKRMLLRLGQEAGLTPQQAQQGWDAISAGNHIGGAYAMEMLLNYAKKTGEATFISSQPGNNTNSVMSSAQAQAEIDSLKKDRGFYDKLMKKDSEATRRWTDLHKLANPSRAA